MKGDLFQVTFRCPVLLRTETVLIVAKNEEEAKNAARNSVPFSYTCVGIEPAEDGESL